MSHVQNDDLVVFNGVKDQERVVADGHHAHAWLIGDLRNFGKFCEQRGRALGPFHDRLCGRRISFGEEARMSLISANAPLV
jgi:hypothetical protein